MNLLIDTCVWLELAKDPDQIKLLNVIDELIELKLVNLLVPETVIAEVKRNKERIVKDSNKGMHAAVKKAKLVVEMHGDTGSRKSVLNHLDDVGFKINSIQESSLHVIKNIERLLEKATIIEITKDVVFRAAQRAIERQAPFHRGKNSMNDAIIIESYHDVIVCSENRDDTFYFVTLNVHDFSDAQGDQRNPHTDFAGFFDGAKSIYSTDLGNVIRTLDRKLIEELFGQQEDFYEEPRLLSEILTAEDELYEKVWYNRHINSLFKTYGNFNLDPEHPGYKAALRIETKYGKENLKWDDFEWGMLNGKLSALRWVTGDDWDDLDT